MCGINGFTWKDRHLIATMNEATAHRGPDDSGVFLGEGVTLGHNRLAIIDLSDAAAQPMTRGDLTIVYNGELYNFEELRRQLVVDWEFKSRGDTEVILAAYAKWGKKCVEKFNGIFAFAVWNARSRELFLARDQLGVKPLYYFYDGTKFIFSSEIKAILEHDIPRTLDREAFSVYLRTLYTPEPHTKFSNIRKFPPAHRATLRGPAFHLERYWRVEESRADLPRAHSERADALRTLVERAVERQLVSDRPVGVYLSGGLDSSIVLAAAASAHGTMDTFSVGFELGEGEEAEKFNADSVLAERTAEYFSARHHPVTLAAHEVPALLEKAVYHLDEPISNPTALAQMKLADFTKQSVAVTLSGDGGDELFGGYERYQFSLLSSQYRAYVPGALRGLLERGEAALLGTDRLRKLGVPAGAERFALFMFQKNPVLEAVVPREFAGDFAKRFFEKKYFHPLEGDFTRQFMNADRQSWLVDECLIRTDKTSMSAGLEQRVPLLDREVVEFAWQIPTSEKLSYRRNKLLLREAFRERLPAYLFEAPKRGWFSPAAKWLRRPEVAALAEEVLSPSYYDGTNGLFLWDGVSAMLAAHRSKEKYNLTMLWALLSFQLWARRFRAHL